MFVHVTALQKAGIQELRDGDKVHFTTALNQRSGKTAVDAIKMA